jgi:NAD(P)-dependent dehydrogenase (short-subunit alcohol dehydrogenase family)
MGDRLAGKIAIVTGAARGIGLATATEFLLQGASVALVGRPSGDFDAVCARLAEHYDILQCQADVRDSAACVAAVDAAVRRWNRIDVLFNNAGISFVRRIDELVDEEWRLAFETNVAGQFWFAREVAKVMIRQRSGSIINMASELAFQGQTGHATQSATKGASLAFTRSLAADLAPYGIRVNAVCPGRIDTEALRREYAQTSDPAAKRAADSRAILMRRFGRPEEVAKAVAFLASDDSSYTTAAALPVDGGTINAEPVWPTDRLSGGDLPIDRLAT